ncbi:MAG TPA: hypothetical protein VE782_14780, partial [Myxococcaceae bacterium]|nr:hypothetical protein [Myxococcaceae bacterium]
MIRLYAAATAALLLSACGHAPRVQGLELRVREVPGGYLTGEVSGLERVALLDNKEFVYSIAFSPGAEGVAFSRILGKKFQLALWSLPSPPSLPGNGSGGVPQAIAEVPVNEYAFDVEAVAYSPDGKWVVTAGRDGAVRAFRSADGQRTAESVIGEPLVSIAFVPGDLLAVGSARGLVTLLTWPDLRLAAQKRVHSDEVRALVALPQKRLISGSWDKTIAVLAVEKERLDSGEAGMQPDAEPLREVKRHHFDSYVNDLTADRAGRRLGVAFSAAKAERNRAVYDREKRGQDAPFDLRDMAAIVDMESGAIVRRWTR